MADEATETGGQFCRLVAYPEQSSVPSKMLIEFAGSADVTYATILGIARRYGRYLGAFANNAEGSRRYKTVVGVGAGLFRAMVSGLAVVEFAVPADIAHSASFGITRWRGGCLQTLVEQAESTRRHKTFVSVRAGGQYDRAGAINRRFSLGACHCCGVGPGFGNSGEEGEPHAGELKVEKPPSSESEHQCRLQWRLQWGWSVGLALMGINGIDLPQGIRRKP